MAYDNILVERVTLHIVHGCPLSFFLQNIQGIIGACMHVQCVQLRPGERANHLYEHRHIIFSFVLMQ